MTQTQANKLARQVQARFDVYFKNTYQKHPGKHWNQRPMEDGQDVASKTITTNCVPVSLGPKTQAFRVTVKSAEPQFVEAAFYPNQINAELRQLVGYDLQAVNSVADLRRGELFFAYRMTGTNQYCHFNFRIK